MRRQSGIRVRIMMLRPLVLCCVVLTASRAIAETPARPSTTVTPRVRQDASGNERPQEKLSSRALTREFEKVWQSFVEKFRSESDTKARLKLMQSYSERAEKLLEPYVGEDAIRRVMPVMATTKLLDLDSTFLAIAAKHPNDSVKATALLHFAEYLGNNRRSEELEVTLRHLRKKYGKLRFRRGTFATAADEAGHFFKHLAVGCEAPATSGQDVDGTLFSLSDYQGKVVMLRFWGDWCPACRAMYPYERNITHKYRNRPFALIGVNSDPEKRCRKAQVQSDLTWRSFWDGGNTGGPIATLYQVEDWPRIIIIDAQGTIRMNARGLDEDYVSKLLDRLIHEAEQNEIAE